MKIIRLTLFSKLEKFKDISVSGPVTEVIRSMTMKSHPLL